MLSSHPPFDLYVNSEDKVVANFYTPGFTKDKLTVKFNNGYLSVGGKREAASGVYTYLVKNFNDKPDFYTKLYVGKTYEAENATYLDGILQVTMKKIDTEDGAMTVPIS